MSLHICNSFDVIYKLKFAV